MTLEMSSDVARACIVAVVMMGGPAMVRSMLVRRRGSVPKAMMLTDVGANKRADSRS